MAYYPLRYHITKAFKGINVSAIKTEGNNNPEKKDRFFCAPRFLPISQLALVDTKWTLDSFLMLNLSRGDVRI